MALGSLETEADLEAFIQRTLEASDLAVQLQTLTTGIITGTGSPEGVVAAPVGAVFQRVDGGAGTTFYVKESGGADVNTGWVAK